MLPPARSLVALGLLVVAGPAWAQLQPASVFVSGAVLQRDAPIPVWGQAAAGAGVTATLAGTTATVAAAALAAGVYEVHLTSGTASLSRSLTVIR